MRLRVSRTAGACADKSHNSFSRRADHLGINILSRAPLHFSRHIAILQVGERLDRPYVFVPVLMSRCNCKPGPFRDHCSRWTRTFRRRPPILRYCPSLRVRSRARYGIVFFATCYRSKVRERNKEAIATRRAGSRPSGACTCQCLTGSRVTLFPPSGCASPWLCTRSPVYDFALSYTYADVRSATALPLTIPSTEPGDSAVVESRRRQRDGRPVALHSYFHE